MIYLVVNRVAWEGDYVRCATNNLAFAEDVYRKEALKEHGSHSFMLLVCLDGQKHYTDDIDTNETVLKRSGGFGEE